MGHPIFSWTPFIRTNPNAPFIRLGETFCQICISSKDLDTMARRPLMLIDIRLVETICGRRAVS